MSVIAGVCLSVTVLIKNRWPSGDTTYCGPNGPWIAPPTRVVNSGAGTPASIASPKVGKALKFCEKKELLELVPTEKSVAPEQRS